ncbi:MAG: hypothetical protein H7210_06535 [Pyrinomonadaceae bacterium]|nr:hypothetical protein [Phycisphaerales bacterium]
MPQSGKAWEFIPLALQVLRSLPDDQQMRFVLATVYTKFLLRTPAQEQLAGLTPQTSAIPAVTALIAQVSQLATGRIDNASLIRQCRQNVEALAARGIDLSSHMESWAASLDHSEFYSMLGGNVARRAAAGEVDRPWARLRDDAGEARVFPLPHLVDAKEQGANVKPYTLEGIDPPWMLQRIYETTPAKKDGYNVRIRVVQSDVMELLDGLALADLRDQVSDQRVQWFIGPDAALTLAADLRERLGTQMLGPVVTLSTVRTRAVPAVESVLAAAAREQGILHTTLGDRVRATYKGRTPAYWNRRISAAMDRSAPPGAAPATARQLRVLIPTCRFSTFIQHSSADLAEAFRHAGHEARIVIEPDPYSHLSSIAYLRAVDEFEPDVVLLINYTRQVLESAVPENVPFVTWLQDSMPHQFNSKIGKALGPLDFVVGHLHPELVTQFGYPAERSLSFPVVVSPRKFHAATPNAALLRKHECEIAYVSHHSETPETMHARLVAEAGRTTPAARVLNGLWPDVCDIALDSFNRAAHHELRDAARRHAGLILNANPDEQTVTQLMRQYCLPVADRIVRHQTLHWAADLADKRGWRLHLHGRGWEQHPRLGRYARGELGHNEELRAAYFAAKLHLQATINTPVHQRVMECAMSGGLPLCRLTRGLIHALTGRFCGSLVRDASPDVCSMDREYLGYSVADSPTAMACLTQFQRLGVPLPCVQSGWMYIHKKWIDYHTGSEAIRNSDMMGLEELLGDLSRFTFSDAASLEALASRAVEDPHWRETGSELIAGRVRAGLTHDMFAAKVLNLIINSTAR